MRTLILMLATLATAPALAQAQSQQSDGERIGDKAENIARQPMKDVGIMRENPPEVLKDAQRAPYSLAGIKNCRDFRRAVIELDNVLGPDVDAVDEKGDALPERLAEAGAKSIVNSLIPFRGIVREATGAAEADRKFRMMVAAGMARRGFLKGVARERQCSVR
ncbi:MAG: hypothetical protein DI568_13635 [Sphingomonas sp.]|nr:MAG: hypothetical protein DI568_13635 [Sphingomonas sp.]